MEIRSPIAELFRESLPLKKQYVLWGIPLGMYICWAIFYPGSIGKLLFLVAAAGVRQLTMSGDYWRDTWKYYRGWWVIGGLLAAIPYDMLVEERAGGLHSSVGLVVFYAVLLAAHFATVYFRRKWDAEEEDGVEKKPMSPKGKAVLIVSVSLAAVLLLVSVIKPHIVRFPKEAPVSWHKIVGDQTVYELSFEDAAELVEILNSYWGWEYTNRNCFTLKVITVGEMTVYMDDSCTHCHYTNGERMMHLDLKEKDTAALKAIFDRN